MSEAACPQGESRKAAPSQKATEETEELRAKFFDFKIQLQIHRIDAVKDEQICLTVIEAVRKFANTNSIRQSQPSLRACSTMGADEGFVPQPSRHPLLFSLSYSLYPDIFDL
jgi:hypothetical protein